MGRPGILIIDDNIHFSESLSRLLKGKGFHVFSSANSKEAFKLLSEERINYILLDVQLGREYGPDVLKVIIDRYSSIPVIMLTGFGTIESAVTSIKMGAYDYVQKPVKLNKLLGILDNAGMSNDAAPPEGNEVQFVSINPLVLEMRKTAERIAPTDIPVLIFGENGTGKEVLADFIQSRSGRREGKYIKINCASFSETLLDNELFGHEKGAYTGADKTYKGVFEKADGGTLFLDEIGEMPISVQSKVLRVLQNKELYRLGGEDLIHIDIRIIAATNRNLEDAISKKMFRQDLYYRLNAAMINIPPLRERMEDIEPLMETFVSFFTGKHGILEKRISTEVLELLHNHKWPGNIRELKNLADYAVALSRDDLIKRNDLPPHFLAQIGSLLKGSLLERTEKDVILQELKKCKFNKKKAAQALAMSRSTLYSKLRKYDISG